MNGPKIRELIDKNNEKIDGFSFILKEEALAAIKDNKRLRGLCAHQFENGFCVYCDETELD